MEGLVFDFDGTLVDSMPMHFRCWTEALAPTGLRLDHATFLAWGGVPTRAIIERLAAEQGISVDVEAVAADKEALARARAHACRLLEPVVAIARAHRGVLPMAIATGGPRAEVGPRLSSLGIAGWFVAVVTSEDVTHGKPHPEPFLHAAALLGVDPSRCRAYEDAPAGIEAAKAAGMEVVDVATLIRPAGAERT